MQEGSDLSAELGIPGARKVQLIKDTIDSEGESIVITQVPLAGGLTADYQLEAFDIFTPDAQLVAMADGVETPLPRPNIRFYRGHPLDGTPGSMFLSVTETSFRAYIEYDGETTYIVPSETEEGFHIAVPGDSLPLMPMEMFCGSDTLPENRAYIERFAEGVDQVLSALTTDRLEVDLMLDVGYGLYDGVFGRSTTTATNYATDLVGAVSAIYERDVNVQLRISTLTIWTTADPFGGSNSNQQLDNYQTYVIANRSGISRDLAHLLDNQTGDGGIAYLDVLCSNSFGLGVSNIYGTVNFPAPGYTWDVHVLSHELGHNFGSPHTHCYSPPIDMCYGQQPGCYIGPSVPTTGTIMSYCHLTSGGVNLVFHSRVISVIRAEAEAAGCVASVSSTPSLTVNAPNGGENWQIGTSHTIQWNSSNLSGNVKIELSRNGGSSYETLFANTSNDGSQNWTVSGSATTQARIKISSVADSTVNDTSNTNFTISDPPPSGPSITVITPNGGENWQVGSTQTIQWTSNDITGNVKIRISRNGGNVYTSIFSNVPNTGSIQWTVTGSATTQARIQVMSAQNTSIRDDSDANFTISAAPPSPPSITVITPNGGENWPVGSTQTIQWNSSNLTGNVKIELSRNGGTTYETLVANTSNDGSQTWTVSGSVTTQARIRISSVATPSVNDTSNANFTISNPPPSGPSITVITPNGGEDWPVGSTRTIQWTSNGITGNVKIRISRNGGNVFTSIFSSVPDTGSIQWTVTGPATTQARIQVMSARDTSIRDDSDANFIISEAPSPSSSITVLTPNGGEDWPTGLAQTIQWDSNNLSGNVKIELSRNGGNTYETLFANTSNDGSQTWAVSGLASNNCRIRISSIDTPSVSDLSDGAFTISDSPSGPSITVLTPNGGEAWAIGSTQTIQWNSSGVNGDVKIRISRNGGNTFTTIFSRAPNTGSIQWTVTGSASAQCKIQVGNLDGSVRDVSDGNFSITP